MRFDVSRKRGNGIKVSAVKEKSGWSGKPQPLKKIKKRCMNSTTIVQEGGPRSKTEQFLRSGAAKRQEEKVSSSSNA